jgi:hypothetical protein
MTLESVIGREKKVMKNKHYYEINCGYKNCTLV